MIYRNIIFTDLNNAGNWNDKEGYSLFSDLLLLKYMLKNFTTLKYGAVFCRGWSKKFAKDKKISKTLSVDF